MKVLASLVNITILLICAHLFIYQVQIKAARKFNIEHIFEEFVEQRKEKAEEDKRHEELMCLATNVYHEARSEGEQGRRAVAWVTLNRTMSKHYPATICEVVHQAVKDEKGNPVKNKCQFSWYCDGKADNIEDQKAWLEAETIAIDVLEKFGKETDPTGRSVMYHAEYVEPDWIDTYKREVEIDSHIFYAEAEND